jgi:hypothetical protein
LKGLVDQDAQDLVLRLARHVGDLVDEQRAAMRLFERADLAFLGAVMGLDTEHFRLHPLRRDGGGIYDHERALRAAGLGVQRARGQFLAGAERADDQHPAVGRCHLLDD